MWCWRLICTTIARGSCHFYSAASLLKSIPPLYSLAPHLSPVPFLTFSRVPLIHCGKIEFYSVFSGRMVLYCNSNFIEDSKRQFSALKSHQRFNLIGRNIRIVRKFLAQNFMINEFWLNFAYYLGSLDLFTSF